MIFSTVSFLISKIKSQLPNWSSDLVKLYCMLSSTSITILKWCNIFSLSIININILISHTVPIFIPIQNILLWHVPILILFFLGGGGGDLGFHYFFCHMISHRLTAKSWLAIWKRSRKADKHCLTQVTGKLLTCPGQDSNPGNGEGHLAVSLSLW